MKPLLSLLTLPLLCTASSIVVPNGTDTTPSFAFVSGLINGQQTEVFEVILGSSQLTGIPLGSQITGIGFRMPIFAPPYPAIDILYYDFQMFFGRAAGEPGTQSLNPLLNFKDPQRVISPPLQIPANTFVGGQFAFLHFDSPYIYNGGPLAAYWSGLPIAGPNGFPFFDAVPSQPGVSTFIYNTLIPYQFINPGIAPVVALEFTAPGSPVPEPGTVWMGFSLIGVAIVARRFQRKLAAE